MFAVIKSGGLQHKVSVGQQLEVNRLPYEDGTQIRIEEVLLISDADTTRIGAPFVDNAAVLATVEKQARGEKLIVFKYKSKKRYRHRRGHRQELTVLRIDDILADGKSLISDEDRSAARPVAQTPAPAPVVEETTDRPRRRRTEQAAVESSTEE